MLRGVGMADAALVIIILAREFIVTSHPLVAAGGGKVIAANLWGKAKTVSQIFAILLVLALQAVNSATGSLSELFWWIRLRGSVRLYGSHTDLRRRLFVEKPVPDKKCEITGILPRFRI